MDTLIYKLIFGSGRWWLIRHFSFWVFMYLDLILSDILVPPEEAAGYYFSALSLAIDIVVVCINLYVLIPQFLLKRKFAAYVTLTLVTIAIDVSIMMLAESSYYDVTTYPEEWASAFLSTLTLLMTAIAIKIGKYYYKQLQVTKELKQSQTQLEINSLKEQINPHFLFNVLNTIHIQSQTEPESVSDTVLNLSDLLRYQIYEAGESEDVLISKEISFLKNYVELEQLRRDNLKIEWQQEDKIPRIRIKPFLFLPLIENALKHSRRLDGSQSVINVKWEMQKDNISLMVENTIGDVKSNESGGFGLDNLKRRLELLYPNAFNLSLQSKSGIYIASLKIKST